MNDTGSMTNSTPEWRMADGTKVMDEVRVLHFLDFGKARLGTLEWPRGVHDDARAGRAQIRGRCRANVDGGGFYRCCWISRASRPGGVVALCSVASSNNDASVGGGRKPVDEPRTEYAGSSHDHDPRHDKSFCVTTNRLRSAGVGTRQVSRLPNKR